MQLLKLAEAAKLLTISKYVLREKAAAGEIRAVKIGHNWKFLETDIDKFIANCYNKSGSSVFQEKKQCRSINGQASGTFPSITMAKKLEKLLEHRTKPKR